MQNTYDKTEFYSYQVNFGSGFATVQTKMPIPDGVPNRDYAAHLANKLAKVLLIEFRNGLESRVFYKNSIIGYASRNEVA